MLNFPKPSTCLPTSATLSSCDSVTTPYSQADLFLFFLFWQVYLTNIKIHNYNENHKFNTGPKSLLINTLKPFQPYSKYIILQANTSCSKAPNLFIRVGDWVHTKR